MMVSNVLRTTEEAGVRNTVTRRHTLGVYFSSS
jgi:hypothetical protein